MNLQKKLYLITGFLGAGKTTLMKELMHIFGDKKIAAIINEFGQRGIDGILLKNEGLQVTEINNGSIFCVCRSDLFIDALIQALKTDAEIILVEASGLSDPTDMDKILDTVNSLAQIEFDYAGAVAVVDATNFLKLINTAAAVSQQIVGSNIAIINKTDLCNEETIKKIEENILLLNPNAIIIKTTFSKIDNPELITNMDMTSENKHKSLVKKRTIGTQKLLVRFQNMYEKRVLEQWINDFSNNFYRIKGFVQLKEGLHYVDGIGGRFSILPSDIIQDEPYLIILASGDSPVKRKIKESWNRHLDEPVNISEG